MTSPIAMLTEGLFHAQPSGLKRGLLHWFNPDLNGQKYPEIDRFSLICRRFQLKRLASQPFDPKWGVETPPFGGSGDPLFGGPFQPDLTLVWPEKDVKKGSKNAFFALQNRPKPQGLVGLPPILVEISI
jgi:hypothetical protein